MPSYKGEMAKCQNMVSAGEPLDTGGLLSWYTRALLECIE